MSSQLWLIALSNTIHLLATVIWIGWSALLPLLIAPRVVAAHRAGPGWESTLLRRMTPLAYGALAALGATGMLQMGADPHYEGMFALGNFWSALLFAKHGLIGASVLLILFQGHAVSPRLRLALRREALGHASDALPLAARFRAVAWLNFAAGMGVLLLTGLMTALP